MSARLAKIVAVFHHLAMVSYYLAAAAAGYLAAGGTRQVKFAQGNLHLLHSEKNTVRHSSVSFELLLILPYYFWSIVRSQITGLLS
jgi:hypothetical protein